MKYAYDIAGLIGEVDAHDMPAAVRAALADVFAESDLPFVNRLDVNFCVRVLPAEDAPWVWKAPKQEREFIFFNHHSKGNPFLRALFRDGYRRSGNFSTYRKVDFILADQAILGRKNHLRDFHLAGTRRFFVYPHTARPNLVNDIVPEFEHITAQFVVSESHAEVMRAYGYSKPLHAVGWSLCPIQSFRSHKEPRKVLFAPIHPRCAQIDQDVNRATFDRLFRLAQSDDIELTVRYTGKLGEAGLERVAHRNVTWFQGKLDPDFHQIDEADVVVSHQTFAWMAVARGVPTVMMAEDMPTHIQILGDDVQYAPNWKKYHHLIAYPLDILSVLPCEALGLLQRAVASDEPISDWRARMIGQPFDPERFVAILEGYLTDTK